MNNQDSNKNELPTIEQQKPYFKSLSWLPILVGALIAGSGVIYGIATAIIASSVGIFFIYAIVGIIAGVITFVIMRIVLSSQILTVLYLEKISKDVAELKNSQRTANSAPDPIEPEICSSKTDEAPQTEDRKLRAIEKLNEILEISVQENFYRELNSWFDEFQKELLKWNVDVYKNINLFFYQSVDEQDYEKMRTVLREFIANDMPDSHK